MSVIVAYKYAANPQDAAVGQDGVVDWSRAKAGVSEYDPVAISLGRNLADAQGVELIGISVGTAEVATSKATKAAMSRGFDKGVVVADDATAEWNSTRTARALAALVERVADADIVITGDSSVDEGARMMSALVAGFLGWACFQDVVSIDKTDAGYTLVQQVNGGTRTVEVSGSVVVSAASDALTPKVPSMKEILAAGKKPVEVVPAADVDLSEAKVTVLSHAKPEFKERKSIIFAGETAVADAVAALRADGIL
ncbi:electron transfer flavoprotein subunit beta/FixA family protein [Arcanobacterium bovis]|uniref:Electron transfer flavoprotein small subunit n=1 Tax=Arcanobacterium bovis TaxID=2529275 RepID=A0A4Q9V254_9ACTO|nr:electron transfer flavoprotein beta subunit/FixA family protein [Arcanobacterium bovis]TBW23715.1 electron transfer flavoprotein beta subunit/FixA family protein [Arcanobacterium bovis]